MNTKTMILACFAIFMTGCAGTLLEPVAVSDADKQQILSATAITVTMQETPGFLFNTPTGAVVDSGMWRWKDPSQALSFGGIRSAHGIQDFTEALRTKFTDGLEASYGSKPFEMAEARQPYSTKLEVAYVDQYTSEYVLEVRTQYGSFHYLPLNWKTYAFNYTGQARVIRASDQAVVWKGTCTVKASDDPVLKVPGPDFFEGDGTQLKEAAEYVTNQCANQLLAQFG